MTKKASELRVGSLISAKAVLLSALASFRIVDSNVLNVDMNEFEADICLRHAGCQSGRNCLSRFRGGSMGALCCHP